VYKNDLKFSSVCGKNLRRPQAAGGGRLTHTVCDYDTSTSRTERQTDRRLAAAISRCRSIAR